MNHGDNPSLAKRSRNGGIVVKSQSLARTKKRVLSSLRMLKGLPHPAFKHKKDNTHPGRAMHSLESICKRW